MIKINVAKYIVEFFKSKGINYYFGHPGGMISFLTDEISKDTSSYDFVFHHEQAAAFAACGLSQITKKPTVAYSTSGPGFTNLITGIANAYYDSIPVFFITGNVSSSDSIESFGFENKNDLPRQHGFQETDVISIIKPIVKDAIYISNKDMIQKELNRLYQLSMEGRKGPVLVDLPINILKEEIYLDNNEKEIDQHSNIDFLSLNNEINQKYHELIEDIKSAKRPFLILGSGCHSVEKTELLKNLIIRLDIPYATSMVSTGFGNLVPELYQGFLGVYGHRIVNYAIEESDLILSLGSRLDLRQIGYGKNNLIQKHKLYRVDVDSGELQINKSSNEIKFQLDLNSFLEHLNVKLVSTYNFDYWKNNILIAKSKIFESESLDTLYDFIKELSSHIPYIFTDVGQNQVWTSQKLKVSSNQMIYQSGGHGAMGYSLPASIGAGIGTNSSTLCISGDGGFQMNIQELETIKRLALPVKMIVLNNSSLGMISEFQDIYMESRFSGTKEGYGYSSPNFANIVKSYGIEAKRIKYENINEFELNEIKDSFKSDNPFLLEIIIPSESAIIPRTIFGKGLNDRFPYLDDNVITEIRNILRQNYA